MTSEEYEELTCQIASKYAEAFKMLDPAHSGNRQSQHGASRRTLRADLRIV